MNSNLKYKTDKVIKAKKSRKNNHILKNWWIHLIMLTYSLFCIIPLILVISESFSSDKAIAIKGFSLFPVGFTLNAYKTIFNRPDQIIHSYMITIIVTAIGTIIGVTFTSMLAYVISRKDYPLANKTSFYVFFTMLISGGMVPWYILISKTLGLNNTIYALIIPYLIIPWHVMLMRGFFSDIPTSLIESAKIDGASEYTIFFRIVAPITKSGLATIGLFTMLLFWNDYYLSLMFIENDNLVSLQFLLYRIMSNINFLNSALAIHSGVTSSAEIPTDSARMAMCVLAAGPMLFIFPFFQKYFTKGVTVGAVKG